MDYKKIGETYYIRVDRDDEVIANILDVCKKRIHPFCCVLWYRWL